MTVVKLSIILFVLGASVFLFSQNIYAELSAPPTSPLVMAIQNNPYYFSEKFELNADF